MGIHFILDTGLTYIEWEKMNTPPPQTVRKLFLTVRHSPFSCLVLLLYSYSSPLHSLYYPNCDVATADIIPMTAILYL